MDRRVERTQKAIFDALIALMDEKPFDKISINEIAERANINRGTVYSHFIDKNDLINKCVVSSIAPFWQGCASAPPEQLMTETFEYIATNANIFNTLLSNGGSPSFRTALQNAMIMNLRKSHKGENANSSEKEITNQFIASAMAGSIEWWIKEKTQVPPETMVTTMLSLLSKLQ